MRFSYLQPFSHDIITQSTNHSNIYIFIGAIPQAHPLESGGGGGVDKESSKKT